MSAPLRILLLAPHPFYQERGTPIAVDLVLRVLSERGDSVDVLTYPEGEDRDYGPAVRLRRIARPPGVRGVRPGLSARKLLCDAWMVPVALRLARHGAYDLVHAVEESVFMAMAIRRRYGVRYVYDMDSSMPLQIGDSHPFLRPAAAAMRAMERRALRGATAVLAVCDSLADLARGAGAADVVTLRDISLLGLPWRDPATCPGPDRPGSAIGLNLLYVGNLEKYQGVDLLLAGLARFSAQRPGAAYLRVVGGAPGHVARYRRTAERLGLRACVQFTGPRPLGDLADVLAGTDVLVSPRVGGDNTPMKIYSYMDSGKPILATRLPTHTQVLSDETALLADPHPEAFAQAIARLADEPPLRAALGAKARETARRKHSWPAFRRTLGEAYARIEAAVKATPARGRC